MHFSTNSFLDESSTFSLFNSIRNQEFFPFIASHLQLDARGNGTNWEELLRTSQMRILLNLCEGATNIDDYTTGIGKCNAIIRQIDEELK